jgi:uncharacterized membrane protein YdbT with pleckstrin-like domain
MNKEISTEERAIWEGNPSQWLNFRTYAYCIIVIVLIIIVLFFITKFRWLFFLLLLYPVLRSLFAWYEVYSIRYKITSARVLRRGGVFSRITTEIKLSEIREVLLIEPWYERIIGLGDIRLNLKGFSESYIIISGIRRADEIKELINKTINRNNEEKSLE